MDGDWVRRYAGEVGELSERVRSVAWGLGSARAETWRSLAAEEFRSRLEEQQRAVALLATGLDDARAALEVHARSVDDVLAGPLGSLAALPAGLLGMRP